MGVPETQLSVGRDGEQLVVLVIELQVDYLCLMSMRLGDLKLGGEVEELELAIDPSAADEAQEGRVLADGDGVLLEEVEVVLVVLPELLELHRVEVPQQAIEGCIEEAAGVRVEDLSNRPTACFHCMFKHNFAPFIHVSIVYRNHFELGISSQHCNQILADLMPIDRYGSAHKGCEVRLRLFLHKQGLLP